MKINYTVRQSRKQQVIDHLMSLGYEWYENQIKWDYPGIRGKYYIMYNPTAEGIKRSDSDVERILISVDHEFVMFGGVKANEEINTLDLENIEDIFSREKLNLP